VDSNVRAEQIRVFCSAKMTLEAAALPEKTLNRERRTMKVKNSLKSLKNRHRDCRVIRRKGRVYVINKTQRRFKARQG